MRKNLRLLLISTLIFLSLFSFSLVGVKTYNAKDDESLYKEKIVAVVYDNSGSMSEYKRSPYAKYALQGLLSIFDYNDTMSIFPLNRCPSENGIEVHLDLEDRNAEVERIIKDSAFEPRRGTGTPAGSVEVATQWLASLGLNENEIVQNKEYWLIILSDGVFDLEGGIQPTTTDVIKRSTEKYKGLQTVYFGISASKDMEIDLSKFDKSTPPVPFYPETAEDIIANMQELSNLVTGRYTITNDNVSINGKEVIVDLSKYEFSISSLAVLAQGAGVIKLDSVTSDTITLKKIRETSIAVDEVVPIANKLFETERVAISGYSSVIVPKDESKYMNKDKVKLTFNDVPQSITILAEPSLKLESSLYYLNDNGDWKKTDIDTINTTFKQGQKIKPTYKLVDGKTGKDLTSQFLESVVANKVSYAGENPDYAEVDKKGVKLKNGKNELNLSVTIDVGNAQYVLFNTWLCDIDAKSEEFYIKGRTTNNYNGDPTLVKADYEVFHYSSSRLGASAFEGEQPEFKWELIEIKDPKGNDVDYIDKFCNDGIISIIYKIDRNKIGSYTSKIKVVCEENKRYRFGECDMTLAVSDLSLNVIQNKELTLTTNQVTDNEKVMEYVLTSSGQDLSITNACLAYEFKSGGVDLSDYAEIDGNVLRFIPNKEIPTDLIGLGERTFDLKVWVKDNPKVVATASCKLNVIKSTYTIEVVEENNSVNIYKLKNSNAKVKFRVAIDGKYYTAKELQEGLDNGSIKIDYDKFGWLTLLMTDRTVEVVENNGQAFIVYSLTSTTPNLFSSLMGSFILTGDKTVTLQTQGVSGVGTVNFLSVTIVSRILRWIIILLILYLITHIVLWIVGFFTAKAIPKGIFTKISANSNTGAVTFNSYEINFDIGPKIKWHLLRFIPFMEFKSQPDIDSGVSGIQCIMFIDKDTNMAYMNFSKNTFETIKANINTPKGRIFARYLESCRDYKGQTARPRREEFKYDDLKKVIVPGTKVVTKDDKCDINYSDSSYYIIKNSSDNSIKEVYFFVHLNK